MCTCRPYIVLDITIHLYMLYVMCVYIYIYIYIYTSVDPCISMHGASWLGACWLELSGIEQHLRGLLWTHTLSDAEPAWKGLWAALGWLEILLEPSWGLLERSRGRLEASWSALGAILKPLRALLNRLEASWSTLGAVLRPLGALF